MPIQDTYNAEAIMSERQLNHVGWFEVATDKPEEAKAFYGELFGWQFEADKGGGLPYSMITTPGAERPTGGLFDSRGEFPGYAIFYVGVEDVAATLAKAESLGGKTVLGPITTDDGLVFAQLRDAHGHHFGIFLPPQA